jgi:DNA-binding transcriptional MocR family regulator
VALCAEHGIPLIEDDIYGDLGFDDERPIVAKAYDEDRSVLLCSSFSKTMAPGYRVGWVVAGKHFQELQRRKYASSVCSAGLTQRVIAEFLSNGGYDHYLRRARKAYATSVGRVADAIARYFPAGTKMSRPLGGFVVWVELPEVVDTMKLFARARDAGIVFAPGPIFTAQDAYRNCMRITASRWSPDVEGAIARLGRLAERALGDT